MPRRNHNAQPVYKPKESLISLLPYGGRIEMRSPIRIKPTGIKTTGESIVKEFRREEREKPNPTFQPYRVIPQSPPSFIRRIFDRINWGILFDWTCAILATIAIAYIFAFIVFGPFLGKEFWK